MPTATLDEATAEVTEAAESTKPVVKFSHRGISASVFLNKTKEGDKPFYKTVVQRTFKVGEDFKSNASFTRDELPIATHLMEKAYGWILDIEGNQA